VAAVAPGAGAAETSRGRFPFLGLDVVVEVADPYREHSFGTLRAVMKALERTGLSCQNDAYEYGVSVSCGTGDERVLIGLITSPTRHPDRLLVDDIRPKGVESTPLPASEHIPFLTDLLRRKPK
jgi:hypothetical protein